MGKKLKLIIANLLFAGITLTSGCTSDKTQANLNNNSKGVNASVNAEKKTKEIKYKDGVYDIKTDSDSEGFYDKVKVTIKNNKITNVEWNIYDSTGRVFDQTYEEVYAGQPEYQEQCRNDLKGAKTYGPKLIDVQDAEKVDAISGATWANKHFKWAVEMALEKAKM